MIAARSRSYALKSGSRVLGQNDRDAASLTLRRAAASVGLAPVCGDRFTIARSWSDIQPVILLHMGHVHPGFRDDVLRRNKKSCWKYAYLAKP